MAVSLRRTPVHEKSLKLVPQSTSKLFYTLILGISIIAAISNVAAIFSIIHRKSRLIQKTCIICLAVADIFSVVMFATNCLDSLRQELKIWTLGEFLCHFLPMGQILGTCVSCVSLLTIAFDRYWNVIHCMKKKWDPGLWLCLSGAILIWILSAALCYPTYRDFIYVPIYVIYSNNKTEEAYMCFASVKKDLGAYYISITIIMFLPMFITFVWLYYKIASLIWKHRKPVSAKFYDRESTSDTSAATDKTIVKKNKNFQVERKIRTFKIVVVLMLMFVVCRLPYWVYNVIKMAWTIGGANMWNTQYTVITINLSNCMFNPFLYTFLNGTIATLKSINDFFCKILCCCFSNAEFEEFEKGIPFVVEYHEEQPPRIVMEHVKDDNRF